jgi:hypothetical protein
MTHHTESAATPGATAAPPARQVSFALLTWVEIRKLLDTRSSFAILAVLAAVAAALVAGLALFSHSQGTPMTFAGYAGGIGLFTGLAMPLIGILGMTSDFSHRTTFVYYPLLRGRTGQFWAKVVAAVAVALTLQLFVLLCSGVTAGFTMGNAAPTDVFQDSAGVIGRGLAACLLGTMFGVALAAAIRRTALTIVAVILITLVGNGLIIALLPDASGYLSTITAIAVIAGGPEAPSVLEACTSLAIWYALPLGIGWWITERGEA